MVLGQNKKVCKTAFMHNWQINFILLLNELQIKSRTTEYHSIIIFFIRYWLFQVAWNVRKFQCPDRQ